jgi:hypothetical protein
MWRKSVVTSLESLRKTYNQEINQLPCRTVRHEAHYHCKKGREEREKESFADKYCCWAKVLAINPHMLVIWTLTGVA